LTTTIFRKNKSGAYMASDSRVSWIDKSTNLPNKWFDSKDYLKTITLDGVLYGFAGTNVIFKMYMKLYTDKAKSESLLDTLVEFAKQNIIQFFIIRYVDNELKLFAYSPPNPYENNRQEIYRISKDPLINKNSYAIGSGKYSKEYKKNRFNSSVQLPIRKIISANLAGFKKEGMLELLHKVTVTNNILTHDESREAYLACQRKGGDLFTGGEVNMSRNANKQQLAEQIQIMDDMDKLAKANGAICASPVNAALEVDQLIRLGQYAVSPYKVEKTTEHSALLNKMNHIFNAST
jgi:hypothetical protein